MAARKDTAAGKGLTEKQKRFCGEYLKDLNGKAAAKRAGYSKKSADIIAAQLMSLPYVRKDIDDRIKARAKRVEITQDMIVKELAKIAFVNLDDFRSDDGKTLDLSKAGRDQMAAVTEFSSSSGENGIHNKVKLADKQAALINLGKHLGMFIDRKSIKMEGPITVEHIQNLSDAELDKILSSEAAIAAGVSEAVDDESGA